MLICTRVHIRRDLFCLTALLSVTELPHLLDYMPVPFMSFETTNIVTVHGWHLLMKKCITPCSK